MHADLARFKNVNRRGSALGWDGWIMNVCMADCDVGWHGFSYFLCILIVFAREWCDMNECSG